MAAQMIDAWMQHPTVRHANDPMFASLWRWTGAEPPSEEVPISATIGAMDAAGVDVGIICAWYGPGGDLISNDEVAGWVGEHPDRLRGLAAVDVRDPVAACAELRRRIESGFVGLRLLPWLWERPPDDRLFYPLYATCVELGVPFCLQVGHTGPLRGSEFGRPIPYLDRVALDFPELVIVGGHIGYPWTEEMIALARKYPKVHIDTSAYTVRRYPQPLVDYLRADGREKVLFGSNFPMIDPGRALEDLDALELDDEARDLFLAGNARRVFSLADPS